MQDFVPIDSKEENERLKRTGILLEKKESEDQNKIINLQQWVVLVRQESSVDITPSVVKAPIRDWKIFKDKLREEFDRDDMVTLWKVVKDRFKEELPKSDLEKCLFWPLKVKFKPVPTDGLWQFEAPIKSWKLYKSCRVHYLMREGMIIYMLDDVEYPLQKSTLQKMLDHKCEIRCIFFARYGILSGIQERLLEMPTQRWEEIEEELLTLRERASRAETKGITLRARVRSLELMETWFHGIVRDEREARERLERQLGLTQEELESLRRSRLP
ncbi:hypothetical protein Tco_0880941 [Tanacetum coccineum]